MIFFACLLPEQTVEFRESLETRLTELAADYNLDDFQFPSFVIKSGFRQKVLRWFE